MTCLDLPASELDTAEGCFPKQDLLARGLLITTTPLISLSHRMTLSTSSCCRPQFLSTSFVYLLTIERLFSCVCVYVGVCVWVGVCVGVWVCVCVMWMLPL